MTSIRLSPGVIVLSVLGLSAVDVPRAASKATFTPLPGMMFTYHMNDLGDVIVGEAPPTDGVHGEGAVAIRKSGPAWNVGGIGTFPTSDPHYSPVFGVTRNGKRVVGLGSRGDPALDTPFHGNPSGPPTALAMLPGDQLASARAISGNGKVIVGWGRTNRTDRFRAGDAMSHAIVWSTSSLTPTLLDALPDAPEESQAMAVTATHLMIAGFATSSASKNYPFDPATESR